MGGSPYLRRGFNPEWGDQAKVIFPFGTLVAEQLFQEEAVEDYTSQIGHIIPLIMLMRNLGECEVPGTPVMTCYYFSSTSLES